MSKGIQIFKTCRWKVLRGLHVTPGDARLISLRILTYFQKPFLAVQIWNTPPIRGKCTATPFWWLPQNSICLQRFPRLNTCVLKTKYFETECVLLVIRRKVSWRFLDDVMACKRMAMSSNRNIFRVTSPLWGEFTGHRWIPLTKASDAELLCFLWSGPEYTVE